MRSSVWRWPPCDLIVLDLNMPDMHGLEVLGFVRSHQKYRSVPVIVLTTRGDEASRAGGDAGGGERLPDEAVPPDVLADRGG